MAPVKPADIGIFSGTQTFGPQQPDTYSSCRQTASLVIEVFLSPVFECLVPETVFCPQYAKLME